VNLVDTRTLRQLGARSIRSLLHWLGFELVNRDAYMQDLARTAHLRSLFRALGINTVIDIGANRGQSIVAFRNAVPDCRIVGTSLEDFDDEAFAGAHHLGTLGEPFQWYAFLFRTMAGAFFAALFIYRGFGIAAGTHAAYDMLVGLI
jgi:membrane protease YdiL (CAAX protease family)